jgi:hypothetical protein
MLQVNALATLQQLKGLMVRLLDTPWNFKVKNLQQLSRLCNLKLLAVELPDFKQLPGKQLQGVLASMPHVQSVKLYVAAERVPAAKEVVQEALCELAVAGDEWPTDVQVAAFDPDVEYEE